jgi:hypothetical protein
VEDDDDDDNEENIKCFWAYKGLVQGYNNGQ